MDIIVFPNYEPNCLELNMDIAGIALQREASCLFLIVTSMILQVFIALRCH